MRRLDMYEIPYDVTPGVPAFATATCNCPGPGAHAARKSPNSDRHADRWEGIPHAGGRGLGIPRRTSGNAGHSSLHSQSRQGGAGTGSSLWSRLSGRCRLSDNWLMKKLFSGTLADIREKGAARRKKCTRTALRLVRPCFGNGDCAACRFSTPEVLRHDAPPRAVTPSCGPMQLIGSS